MNMFDIIGPIMVGPSSSHTAGACRIGYVAVSLLGEKAVEAKILLHGSFAHTGLGHGTNRALVAGILGMKPDNELLKDSLEIAEEHGLKVSFEDVELDDAHPNTAVIYLTGQSGKNKMIQAASVGGGNIEVTKIDGHNVYISAQYPTVVVSLKDTPGAFSKVTYTIGQLGYNIFKINVDRDKRGGSAIMSLEMDGTSVLPDLKEALLAVPNVLEVIILQPC